ncbi:MAG: ATP-binding cassette domain-containing protein [Candidatus Melainabacteria bacterium]|nr:ATP-binding cassette domain-containing protein [Candidatus Melainabacteria bacterium]
MIRLDRISKVYPHGEVLKEITWEVKAGERAGLVGANGSGKTTQFRIILGELEPTSGDVFRAKDARIAYLSQEFEINPDNTIRDELLTAFSEAHQIKMSLLRVQEALDSAGGEELEKLLRKLDRLQQEFEAADGYGLERRVEKILPDIGLSTADGDRLVSSLSGGWQMRLGFGKVMLRQPDLLLLDEPTNHIDLETIEWLEGYLLKQTVPMVIVSHDRRFLDRLCTKIIEVERGVATTYPGNYSSYVAVKEEIRAAQQAAYERQQEELARQQAFIDRFRASATRSTQAKSREKQIEKIEKIEAPVSELRGLKFHFPACARSGKEVAIVDSLMHAYDDNILFLDASLDIERGDKIALIGPNGCGKSTLLRLLTGREKPMEGEVRLGEHNIITGYFEQNQAEALDRDKTVLDTIADDVYHWKDVEIRGLLGRFLFSGDTVYKRVSDLSGGEKARLALAKLLTRQVNFLILDEPTNHLDIPAKETLEDAIRSFDGAVVVVSHDRYFISQIASKIIEIKDASFKVYEGGYEYYLERVEKERQEAIEAELEKERLERQAARRARQKEKETARKAARKEKEKS